MNNFHQSCHPTLRIFGRADAEVDAAAFSGEFDFGTALNIDELSGLSGSQPSAPAPEHN